ncbi:MAG: acetyl-CoA C-acetyltransferase [Gemmatimonadetes bacterium]|nr:acetyl-CoA C-acetyltransferase [Gemmatimonadota bacterium]
MTEAYLYDAIRTPRGKGKKDGSLHQITPIELLAGLLRTLEDRNGLDTSVVDDVVIGCVTPVGDQGGNIARFAVIFAGWSVDVPAMQINRFCSSGLDAVNLAAMKVQSGWEKLVVAGGVESMSRVPMMSDGGAGFFDPKVSLETGSIPQGVSADLLATIEGITREDLDIYALRSQQLAATASENGHFESVIPVVDSNGATVLGRDELIRPGATLDGLGELSPAFETIGSYGFDAVALQKYPEVERIAHIHTAGNSSGIVDGAAVVLVGSKEAGEALGFEPRARIVAGAQVATDPTIMLVGPGPASKRALEKAGMKVDDIDLFEVNEAFAAVPLRFAREMKLDDLDRINVNGGAIAMGHPLGATGTILIGTALDELERRDLNTALITLCVGGGMGAATIIERM